MFSPETLKAQVYELLLSEELQEKRYGKFFALGNDDLLLFDVTNQYPESPADFTENRGRAVITGPVGGSVDDLGRLARWPLTIACFAIAAPDAGFLGEHILRVLKSWSREKFPAMNGQCLQNFHSFRYNGPVRVPQNSLFFSTVQVTATVACQNAA